MNSKQNLNDDKAYLMKTIVMMHNNRNITNDRAVGYDNNSNNA